MWDGKSHDDLRWLRSAIKSDMQHLLSAPLGYTAQKIMVKKIAYQLKELDRLNAEKRNKPKPEPPKGA